MYEKLNSEARLIKIPRLKDVSSRGVRNSISLMRLFNASNNTPKANKSPVRAMESKEINASSEKSNDGMYVFSVKTFLLIRMIPRKAL